MMRTASNRKRGLIMKKKTVLRSVIAAILAMITVFAVTTAAAEYAAGDGMTFEIVTSKQEYGVNEEIQIILLAKNYNDKMKLANISWTAEIPTGELTMLSGELTGTQTVEVGERAVVNYRLMKIVEPPEEPDEPEPTTPSTQPQETPTVEEEGVSGGSIAVLIILIILVLAGIGGIVYLLLKRRGVISCIALLLALGMLLPCIPAVDVSAAGLNVGDVFLGENNVLNASVKFIVDGKEYEATATMTYEMAAQTETVVEAMHSSMSNLEWTQYNAPVVTPTIGEHPRLMFTEEDIPRIVKTLEAEECAEMTQEFYRLLGISFNGSFGTVSITIDENGKEVNNGNFSSDKLNSIRVRALYYALFRDSENEEQAHMAEFYGKTAVRAIQKALETVIFKANDYDIYSRGDCQCAAAEVYDWCYDLLTHEDKQNIVAHALKIGAYSEAGWPINIGDAGNTVVSHLGGNLIQTYWMAMSIAMYDEYPTFFEYIGGAYFQCYIPPRNAWYVSEAHHQGISYGMGGRGDADMTAQYLIYTMTGGDNDRDGDGNADGHVSLNPVAGKAAYQLVYALRPDGQFLREGDTWEENQTNEFEIWDANGVTFERQSNFYKDGVLRRLAMELDNLEYTGTDFLYLLLTHDTEVETKPYSKLPYTKFFPTPSGSMIARTGWDMGTASNDVIVKMQMSQVFVNNHQHHDAGAFQIYYKGILASESGYYTTYGTAHWTNYLSSSIAHNTLSISSITNRYGKQNNVAVTNWGVEGSTDIVNPLIGHEFGPNTYKPEYSYLAGDIANSYDDNVQEAIRSMVFLNLELDGNTQHPGAFIVFDQIKTTQIGSKKSFLLHMQSEPEVDDNVVIIKNTEDDYNGMLTDQVLYVGTASKADSGYVIEKIGGPNKQFVVGQYNYAYNKSVSGTLCQEQGWGRVEISTTTTEENQTDYLLNVMYVGDADSEDEIVPAKLIYDGKGVIMGAQLMNHVAMFNMDGNNRISQDVSFSIPKSEGYETFKVNVAGLKAGTWTVYVNGSSIGTQVASEDGGMIYFEATAGTVKLVRSGSESAKTFDETPITEEEPIGLLINNFFYYTDVHPVVSGDDYLVPVATIFDALNGQGQWNREGTEYTVLYKTATYVFTANSITRDGEVIEFNEMRSANGDLLLDMTTLKALVAEEGEMYYDKYINRIRLNTDAQAAIPALSDDILYDYPTAVQVQGLIDNGYSTLGMVNSIDGDTTTRWCSQESGNNITEGIYDLGKVVPLTEVMIMFWTEEKYYSNYVFDIFVSVDGVEYIPLHEEARSGEISPKTYHETYATFLLDCEARYVKIVGHGRFRYTNAGRPTASPNNTWTQIAEIVFLQKSIIDPNGAPVAGSKLLAEAECFNMQSDGSNASVVIEKNSAASGKEQVLMKVAYTTNPGTVVANAPQLYATFIPQKTAAHYIWAKVNTSKVTSGDSLWVNIEGITGDSYYAEKLNVGKKDKDGFEWVKLGQYEDQTALTEWKANEEYTLSVISGCEGLVIDCFILTTNAAYVPYDECYSKKTSIEGELSVDAKDAIYEHSMAKASGTGAKLQSVSSDGTVSQAYIDYVLKTDNLPGDISLNIVTDTSGKFSIWATMKVSNLSRDQFFYAVSANDAEYNYKLGDLSEMTSVTVGEFVKVKLGEVEIQASESIYVRIKACSNGVTIGTLSTTCEPITGVFTTTDGKVTIQAEDTKLQKAGEETIIVNKGAYYSGEVAQVVNKESAVGGKVVEFPKTHTGWVDLKTATSEATPHLSFQVMPDKSGEYYIWVKVYAVENTALYAWIDGGDDYYYWRQPLTWETSSADTDNYIWVRLYQEAKNKLDKTGIGQYTEHVYSWTARRIYTIGLRGMYAGVQVDEIYITNDPNDAPHNHKYAENWSTDATHHWYAPTCGCSDAEPRYYGEHFFEDHTDKECNTCGYANPNYAPHNYVDGKCTICGGLAPFSTSNGKLTLEAENLMLAPDGKENHIPNHTSSVIKVVESADAEGGKAVQFTKTNSAWNSFLKAGTTPIPHVSALVTPDKSGEYYIWLKVYAPENARYGAALYAYIEGGSDTYYWRQPLDLNGYSQGEMDYFWVRISEEYQSTTTKFADHTYNWTAGQTYALRFRGTVAGVRVDQIYITNSAQDIPHNHTYSTSWEKDDTYHWRKATCEHTDKIVAKFEHTYDNLLDTTCNDCGHVRPDHVHVYSGTWSYNATHHWHECACGDKADYSTHSFDAVACTTCNVGKPFNTSGGKLTVQAENTTLAPAGTENYIMDPSNSTQFYPTQVMSVTANGTAVKVNRGYTNASGMKSAGFDPYPHMMFSVIPDASGEYYIWLKVYAPSSSTNNALYAYIDGGNDSYYWRQPLKKADGSYSENTSDFYWVRVYQEFMQDTYSTGGMYPQNGSDKVYTWTAGEMYTLRFRAHNSSVQVDEIYITNDPGDTPHNHTFSSEWEKDATHHWHKATCDHVELISGKAEHNYETILDTICSDCGYERPAHEHVYADAWSYNTTHHWHECLCGDRKDYAQHTFENRVCTGCSMLQPMEMSGGKLSVEAENANLAENGTENVIMNGSVFWNDVVDVGTADGVTYVKANRGLSYAPTMKNAGLTAIPHISVAVTADTTAQYYIWVRTKGTGMYCYIQGNDENGQPTDTYYWKQVTTQSSEWEWVLLNRDDYYKIDKAYFWTAGETYTVNLRNFATGNLIDQIYISTDLNDPYVKNHEHTFSTQWTTNDTHHWHAATCEHADQVSEKGEHVFTDDADTTCNTCGAERHVHVFTNGVCTCGAREAASTVNGHAVIEAEAWQASTTYATKKENAEASGGYVVHLSTKNDNASALDGTDSVEASIDAVVNPNESGTYYIWVRMGYRSSGGGCNVWVSGDEWADDIGYNEKDPTTGKTGYRYVGFATTTLDESSTTIGWQKLTVTPVWTAGNEYHIKIATTTNKSVCVIDQFVITTDANYTPSGIVSAE
ncbi:MAG: hypothetical protein E7468_06705 [Ruminococcaceae bacterium]|nr:hypothetical protein [Oscillospiraceae bacterium]